MLRPFVSPERVASGKHCHNVELLFEYIDYSQEHDLKVFISGIQYDSWPLWAPGLKGKRYISIVSSQNFYFILQNSH